MRPKIRTKVLQHHDCIENYDEDINTGERTCRICWRVLSNIEIEERVLLEREFNTPTIKQMNKAELLITYIKDKLDLNDSICEEIKRIYIKAFKRGIPRRPGEAGKGRRFYLTECVAACLYIALLPTRKKYYDVRGFMRYEELSDPNEKRQYRRGSSIPRFEYITPERIEKALNSLIKATQLNRYYRHEITSERIERCARLIVKEYGLQVKIPHIPKPFVYKGSDKESFYRYRQKFTKAIDDITVKLGPGKYLDKAFNKFDYRLTKIGIDLIASNGHERKPSVVAAAFVYLASKKTGKKITFRAVQKAVGCGTKSLQKTLRLIN